MHDRYKEFKCDEYKDALKKITNQYFSHLVDEFESALRSCQPGSQPSEWTMYGSPNHQANIAFHHRFAETMMRYDKKLCIDLGMSEYHLADSSLAIQKNILTEMRNAQNSLVNFKNLFNDQGDHLLKQALDFLTDYYTEYYGPSVGDVMKKLQSFSKLQNIILNHNLTSLDHFKKTLQENSKVIDANRGCFHRIFGIWSHGKHTRNHLEEVIKEIEKLEINKQEEKSSLPGNKK